MLKNARNVAIILLIAAAISFLPGGGDAGEVIFGAISIAFFVLIVWVLMRIYRDHRVAIYALGNANRAILYFSIAAIVVASAALADDKLDGALILVWVVVVMAAVAGLYRVWRESRSYGGY